MRQDNEEIVLEAVEKMKSNAICFGGAKNDPNSTRYQMDHNAMLSASAGCQATQVMRLGRKLGVWKTCD